LILLEFTIGENILTASRQQIEITTFNNKLIIENLRKTYNFLADDCTIVLGEPKVRADEYYIDMVDRLIGNETLFI
jgi:hypothetical protein